MVLVQHSPPVYPLKKFGEKISSSAVEAGVQVFSGSYRPFPLQANSSFGVEKEEFEDSFQEQHPVPRPYRICKVF